MLNMALDITMTSWRRDFYISLDLLSTRNDRLTSLLRLHFPLKSLRGEASPHASPHCCVSALSQHTSRSTGRPWLLRVIHRTIFCWVWNMISNQTTLSLKSGNSCDRNLKKHKYLWRSNTCLSGAHWNSLGENWVMLSSLIISKHLSRQLGSSRNIWQHPSSI